jgi:hypothetical protein
VAVRDSGLEGCGERGDLLVDGAQPGLQAAQPALQLPRRRAGDRVRRRRLGRCRTVLAGFQVERAGDRAQHRDQQRRRFRAGDAGGFGAGLGLFLALHRAGEAAAGGPVLGEQRH